jgi:hypothetical protein
MYACHSEGEAAFIWYVTAGEDTFHHVDVSGRYAVVYFTDNITSTQCAELAKLYNSGAQVRDVKEYAICYRQVTHAIRAAFRDRKK